MRQTGNAALTRRAFVGAGVAGAPAVLRGAGKKNNVLFIAADDLCNRIACYGDAAAKTPNLDRLARAGVRFDRAYCQYPLCCPSRTSLMTGHAPDTTRIWGNETHFRSTMPEAVTIPQLFTKNGYFAGRAGKIYHYNNPMDIGTPGLDDAASWQFTVNPVGVDRLRDEAGVVFLTPGNAGRGPGGQAGRGATGAPAGAILSQDGKTPVYPLVNGRLGASIAYNKSDPEEKETDYMVVDAVIDMMRKHSNEPWFLGCGFFKPHVPWIIPSKYFDMFRVDDMTIPPFDPEEMKMAPHWAYTSANPNYGMPPQKHREAIRDYYAAMAFMDTQLGRLLDAVETLGLKNNTTVVLWSDHGFQLGEHGQWQKTMLFEPSARVPLIISGAGVRAAGAACRRTVENLDIYPTLADLCGLRGAPATLQGRSLKPLLSNPNAKWDHPAVSQVMRGGPQGTAVMGYSLRTERHRYTWWAEGREGEELYDYDSRPGESANLAGDPAANALKATLKARLGQICEARGIAGARGVKAVAIGG
jgi:uncharacterized sulfatase